MHNGIGGTRDTEETAWKHCLTGQGPTVRGRGGLLEGVIIAVLGLAELIKEEDDRLQAEHQHDAADEAGRVKGGVLRRNAGGTHWSRGMVGGVRWCSGRRGVGRSSWTSGGRCSSGCV